MVGCSQNGSENVEADNKSSDIEENFDYKQLTKADFKLTKDFQYEIYPHLLAYKIDWENVHPDFAQFALGNLYSPKEKEQKEETKSDNAKEESKEKEEHAAEEVQKEEAEKKANEEQGKQVESTQQPKETQDEAKARIQRENEARVEKLMMEYVGSGHIYDEGMEFIFEHCLNAGEMQDGVNLTCYNLDNGDSGYISDYVEFFINGGSISDLAPY